MTAFSSENAILNWIVEGGQIGQIWAKFRQFYKLCLISQKLSDEFSFYRTKWRLIMTAFSSQNAILIGLPEGGQIWQKFGEISQILQILPNFSETIWWINFLSHQMKAHHDPLLQPKRYFDWIAWRLVNWAKTGENSQILQISS